MPAADIRRRADRYAASEPAFTPADPRWVFATLVAGKLQGGRSALLTVERRERLMALAGQLGLRPFDASLVIAIVQDAARRGEDALGVRTADRLASVRVPAPVRPRGAGAMQAASIALLAVTLAVGVVLWIRAAGG